MLSLLPSASFSLLQLPATPLAAPFVAFAAATGVSTIFLALILFLTTLAKLGVPIEPS